MKWKNIDNNYKDHLESIRDQTPYERLGLEASATIIEIKAAYRRKVSLYHPDRTDIFMTSYSQEVIKLLNQALDQIKTERGL
jgi:DnaJ-class molecular chaperone